MTSRVNTVCLLMIAAVLVPAASADDGVLRGAKDKVESVQAWCVFGYHPGSLANACYSLEQTESEVPSVPFPERNGEFCLIGGLCPPTYTIGETNPVPVEHTTVCILVEVGVHVSYAVCPAFKGIEPT